MRTVRHGWLLRVTLAVTRPCRSNVSSTQSSAAGSAGNTVGSSASRRLRPPGTPTTRASIGPDMTRLVEVTLGTVPAVATLAADALSALVGRRRYPWACHSERGL